MHVKPSKPEKQGLNRKAGFNRYLYLIILIFALSAFTRLCRTDIKSIDNDIVYQSSIIETGYENDKNRMDTQKTDILYNVLVKQLGKPYVYGHYGPDSFDCSGLVMYAYLKLGISLPRVASEQSERGVPVDKDNLVFGDLVYFSSEQSEVDHIGIYVGNRYFIHASQAGKKVIVSSLDSSYYSSVYAGAVKVLQLS